MPKVIHTPQESSLKKLLQRYATEKIELWQNFPFDNVIQACESIWAAYRKQGTIYACGNGGNIAVAANMLNDFATVPFMPDTKDTVLPTTAHRLRVITLGESPTALTATLNDLGPEHIFSDQLKMHRITTEDVLIALSGSGNSKNILTAVAVAKAGGATVVGITRGPQSQLAQQADIAVIIQGQSSYPGQTGGNNFNFHYEDAVSAIGHMITGVLKERIQTHVSTTIRA